MTRNLLLLLTMTLLVPVAAHAQTTGSVSTDAEAVDRVRQAAHVHAGPFYVIPRLLLKQFGVDNNVFYTASDPKSDFTFTIAPQATVYVPVAHTNLFTVSGTADLVYFAKYGTERSIDPEFLVRDEVYLNHVTLYGENSFISSRQRPNYEIDARSRRADNLVSGGLVWHFTPKTSLEAGGRYRTLRYDADAVFDGNSLHDSLNHDSSGFTIVPRFSPTPLTTLAVKIERFDERFPFSPERNNGTLRVMPGVEFKPRALISGSAYVGYHSLSPTHEDLLPAESGLVANLALAYTLLQATTFSVTYDRDVQYSVEEFQPYYISDALGVSIRRALGGHFDVTGSGQRYRYDFRHLSDAPERFQAEREDKVQVVGVSLGYRIQTGRFGVGLSYTQRDSPLPDRTFDGLRFGTTMTYGF